MLSYLTLPVPHRLSKPIKATVLAILYFYHGNIQILRLENIEFVVAPYEADAQLAYLSSLKAEKGGVAAVITEDSDLMAYGCKAVRTSL